MPGVVADGVTVSEDLFDKFRIAFQKCADDEERCRSLMFRKSFQNSRCISVFRTVTALVMIASSLCNYTILTAASKMQPEQVMVMNIVLTAVGVLLGLFVNLRYTKMVEQAQADN